MCRRHLSDGEIVQLMEIDEPLSDTEDDLEYGDEQEKIDDDELDPFLNSINLLDINVDMGDVECEPDGPSISLPNFISVQPHTKNEIYKTLIIKFKKKIQI
ncbi:Hypothetical protein CINCED_3A015829 [Cinara cedri]|uniref:PiggyBac transposable element-derived protein n=1 Tax=Cinara cedri TaxID=506608 RepID=A0A5E4NQZ4_9HEMI|nr:Hypothetical protein CINCED_3A015829 [Cinara cedri]